MRYNDYRVVWIWGCIIRDVYEYAVYIGFIGYIEGKIGVKLLDTSEGYRLEFIFIII